MLIIDNFRNLNKKNHTGVMAFNATFNNISVISWRSVSLVEETELPDTPQTTDKLSHIMYVCVHITMSEIRTHNFTCINLQVIIVCIKSHLFS